jgi:hypothetical protein
MTEKAFQTSQKRERNKTAVNEGSDAVGTPKRQKRRHEDTVDKDINPTVNDAEEAIQLEPQKKKPRKNKTGFPDPEDDSTLSEQASKGWCARCSLKRPLN